MNAILVRRWLIRILAFLSILTYGIFILSSQRQLLRLLNAAFDVSSPEECSADINKFCPTPYHKHIRTIHRANHTEEDIVISSRRGVGRRDAKSHNNSKSNIRSSGEASDYPTVRISFELHDPKTVPLTNKFNLYVKCPLGKVSAGRVRKQPTGEFRSGELPPSLKRVTDVRVNNGGGGGAITTSMPSTRSGRVLDFTTTISTDLKLLLIGDSVLVQLAQAFDEIVGGSGGPHAEQNEENLQKERYPRNIVWEAWRGHNGGTVVGPTRGGGVSAMWRMTGLLSKMNKGKPPANSAGGGWGDFEVNTLLKHEYHPQNAVVPTRIHNFDVVIYRVMHGWMLIHEITHDRLVEAVELAYDLFGATTVVLMTIPFTNNVKTAEVMNKVREVNDDIRQIARGWHTRKEQKGVKHVLVLEYGMYYNHIVWANAIHLGYNVTDPLRATTPEVFETEGPKFLLDRLQDGGAWSPSVPMVCSDTTSLGTTRAKCNRNYLFSDGMHTCPETLASRFSSGLACLIGCAYNNNNRGGQGTATTDYKNTTEKSQLRLEEGIRECEKECNRQFLSVVPVEESWIDSNTAIASFSD